MTGRCPEPFDELRTPPVEGITVTAYAKINLTLEVLGRFPDGYHRVASLLQTIALADRLHLEIGEGISLQCDWPELEGPDNSVLRAAKLLQEKGGFQRGARLRLEKAIPTAAGLGGHSSDAAAALLGLNRLWGLSLPLPRLRELASRLGSDVPFFLYGGTALAEGRGEQITPLPPLAQHWVVLLVPAVALPPHKTERLYQSLKEGHFTDGEMTRRTAMSLRAGQALSPSGLYNAFEQVAFSLFPGLEEARQRLREAGAPQVHLSGSGPTLFALFTQREEAEMVRQRLAEKGEKVYLVPTVGPWGSR